MNKIPKGYKQTEIGIIPEDWDICLLNDYVERLEAGVSVNSIDGESIGVSYDYSVLKTSSIINGLFKPEESKRILPKDIKRAKLNPLKDRIIISRMNTPELVGECGYVSETYLNLFLPDRLWMTVFRKGIHLNAKWLSYILSYPTYKKQIKDSATGTSNSMKNISKDSLLKLSIPSIPLSEQTAIATALSDVDALISSLEKLIEKKRNIKQGAMQKLLQPKEGWEVKKLGEIGECIIGLTYTPDNVKESGTLVLRSSNVQGCSLKYDDNVFVDSKIPEKLINKENDILICVRNGSRNLIGKCALIKGVAIGETFGAFMSVFRSPFNEFVFILFQSEIIKKQIDEHLGATINQITNKSLNSFEIPFPPYEEQIRIATILSDMDAEIEALETKLEKYRNIKLGMMQNLLTGKIRLVETSELRNEKSVEIPKLKLVENKTSPHNWAINEAVVISVLVKHFSNEQFPLGRKRYTKLSYLLHRYVEHQAKGYLKKAAGPYNPDTKYKGPETIAQKNKYIKFVTKEKLNGFVVEQNIKEAEGYFSKWYGNKVIQWLEQFRYVKNDTLELWATVDMAIQDLKSMNSIISVDKIKELMNKEKEWKPKLQREVFSDINIAQAIKKSESLFGES